MGQHSSLPSRLPSPNNTANEILADVLVTKPLSDLAEVQPVQYDNFYTPKNSEFYSKFQYADLRPEEHRIRLLRIHLLQPGEHASAPVQCELLDAISLRDMTGKFTALSYCAGDPKNTDTIIVNGMDFNAFANLGHALRQARHFCKFGLYEDELLLWVDQVCINQSNPSERCHQVDLMGKIYAASKQVLVCLSTEIDVTGGLGWLHTLSRQVGTVHSRGGAAGAFAIGWHNDEFRHGYNAFIHTVLTSPWWSRAWVRQEFVRSPQAYFLASFESADWRLVRMLIDMYCGPMYGYGIRPTTHKELSHPCSTSSSPDQSHLPAMDASNLRAALRRATNLLQAKHVSQSKAIGNLVENLGDAPFCQASDPRDLIYAFLGLSDNRYGIYPDYSPGTCYSDVAVSLARNIITTNGNLLLFEIAWRTHATCGESDLPSWAPDWRYFPIDREERLPHQDKSGATSEIFTFYSDKEGRQDRILELRGILLGLLLSDYHVCQLGYIRHVIHTFGILSPGDECWFIHGEENFVVLRRKGQYRELVGQGFFKTFGPKPCSDPEDGLNQFIKENHANIQTIQIC